MQRNKPLKFVPATKSVASTGLATAHRLAGRNTQLVRITFYHRDKSFHESQVLSIQVLQCHPRSCNQVKLTA